MLLRPAHHGLYSGHQLTQTKRLAEVVIRAQLQADQPIDFFDLGRGDNYRHITLPAQIPTQIQAIAPRQHQVEDNQVGHIVRQPSGHLIASV